MSGASQDFSKMRAEFRRELRVGLVVVELRGSNLPEHRSGSGCHLLRCRGSHLQLLPLRFFLQAIGGRGFGVGRGPGLVAQPCGNFL